MTRHLSLPLCAVYLLLASPTAQAEELADDRAEEARAIFKKGRAAAKRGDQLKRSGQTADAQEAYEFAAAYFIRAYELAPNPKVLYVLGEVYRMRGNVEFAVACYRRFVEQSGTAGGAGPDSSRPADKRIARAREHIAALTSGTGTNVIPEETLPPIGACLPDGQPDDQPTDANADNPAGPARRPILAPSGGQPPDRPPTSRQGYRIGFWASAGVAVAAMAMSGFAHWQVTGTLKDDQLQRITEYQLATGTRLATVDACSDADARRPGTSDQAAELLDGVIAACDSGEATALLANITRGVAVLSIGAAAYLLYRGYLRADRPKKASAWRPSVAPTVTTETVGARLYMRF